MRGRGDAERAGMDRFPGAWTPVVPGGLGRKHRVSAAPVLLNYGTRLGGRSCSGLYLFARIPLAACRQTPTLFAVCIAAVEDDCLISCSITSSAVASSDGGL